MIKNKKLFCNSACAWWYIRKHLSVHFQNLHIGMYIYKIGTAADTLVHLNTAQCLSQCLQKLI